MSLNACNTVKGTATGAGRDMKAVWHYTSCAWDWDKDCQKKQFTVTTVRPKIINFKIRIEYLAHMINSGWKNPYDNSYPATDGKPGKTGMTTRCCINGKEYIEVISFTSKTNYFSTNIQLD